MADEAKRKRASHRAWVTREVNKINKLCDREHPPVNVIELKAAVSLLSEKLDKLKCSQSDVEYFLDETALSVEVEEAGDFFDQAELAKFRAEDLLKSFSREKEEDVISVASGNQSFSQTSFAAKLPQLELPKFNGDNSKGTASLTNSPP